MNKLPKEGVDLIKRFEGCHLTAYPDPKTKGKPYTIGWGSTKKLNGSPFKLGEKITQAEADSLFLHQLEQEYWPGLKKIPYFEDMSEEQQGALLSFAYNLGANFYSSAGFATLSNRLRNRQWQSVPETLLLYRNPGTNVEEGLRRRRVAEGALWSKGLSKSKPVNKEIIAQVNTLLKKEPLQSYQLSPAQKVPVEKGKGYKVLSITDDGIHSKVVLDHGAGTWYIYDPHWKVISLGKPVITPSESFKDKKLLNVRYFPQLDSATIHAKRMCFSSSCAMMADYLNPSAIQVLEQEDDYYMRNYVFKYGDTINPNAQISALRDLGITAQFRQNLSQTDIESQLNKGIPVPIGFFHHGQVNAPTGFGHWICVIGYDKTFQQYIVHDPYGELDLINGGYYGSTNGANQRYSFKNLNRRWMVNANGSYAPGKGWGIIATSW